MTDDDIKRMAMEEANKQWRLFAFQGPKDLAASLAWFATTLVRQEREACAKVADGNRDPQEGGGPSTARSIADAIRARGVEDPSTGGESRG